MLELRHISKRFGDREILSDISLSINQGEIVSILGPSGCGKTTLLNLILGLTDLTEGQLIYDGEDLSHVSMRDRGFNIVFQDFALFPNLNARENILYGLRNNPNASTREEVSDLIDLLGLRKHLDQRIDELSGGQKQRVAIARTLVLKPRLLLLDEPLSALDGIIKESIKERIRTVARQYKLTTLIVTHDPEEALTLSDRVQTIISNPANDFIRQFILSQLNIKRSNILKLFSESLPQTTPASSRIAKPQPFQAFGQAVA